MAEPSKAVVTSDFSGKVALVTGASRGIGRAIATRLGRAGATVACVARNTEKLEEVAQEIRDAGGQASVHQCDVCDAEQIQATVDQIHGQWDAIDILVNNAGITRDTLLLRMSDDDWHDVISSNLSSVFLFTRAVAQVMVRAKSGRIINISSISGLMGNPGQANYSASKAGVIGFTQTVAKELGSKRRPITVNAICPGFIRSDMTDILAEAGGDAFHDVVKQRIPLQRLGEPDEVADAALFLASDSAAYITGQVLTIDGGMTG
ncbi:3-oxoacyl-[acyl-carrier-protein] reductase FabG [Posidoniimonas polymericola]|uniref:3-oxoacyl-[acyl-carrier-protein] reductase n=1 Tax=Posidoniimonas polymericola TaxID=2528002 RepID=A0A5C5YCZ3_9BACT|nr:3-oxoacyl-[acyl-carrier-protein] reductase [Posidoniimonas polymericola]TWT72818.1 3-oxoacyl-[acyl-carrier-protein] reductase FabG [Posidoniimonas polymericola]